MWRFLARAILGVSWFQYLPTNSGIIVAKKRADTYLGGNKFVWRFSVTFRDEFQTTFHPKITENIAKSYIFQRNSEVAKKFEGGKCLGGG